MKTIADPALRADLVRRLRTLTPTTARRWGKMTCPQMLAHVADAMERVTRGERFSAAPKPSRLIKLLALRAPLAWPRGLPTGGDPAARDVDAVRFEGERARAIAALEAMATADGAGFTPAHPAFGPMSTRDWLCWARRHLDHHLKQFGA